MKPEELMIGDYIRNKHTKEIIWIFEIDGDRNVINNEPDGYCSEKNINIDDVEPIPITPEILEKNGFLIYDDDIYLWENVINIVRLYTDDNHTWFLYMCSDICGHIDYLAINSVHELQHALRLCKIDKEIVL